MCYNSHPPVCTVLEGGEAGVGQPVDEGEVGTLLQRGARKDQLRGARALGGVQEEEGGERGEGGVQPADEV